MLNIKDVLKIILVLQLFAYTLATYGHPDAENIDFGSPAQSSRDQMIIEAAVKRGMDGDAVAELLLTKKPVVRTTTTPNGFTKTTTYKLEPDGSISSKSILQKKHRYVYNSDNVPDELKNSPTGTIRRTFIDSNGNKVTQTVAVNQQQPSPSPKIESDDLNSDWFEQPFSSWPEEKPSSLPFETVHRTITRTYTGPNGERRTVQTWSSEPEIREPKPALVPTSRTPDRSTTSTRTYIKPNGQKHFVQTTTSSKPDSSDFPNIPDFPSTDDINLSNFDFAKSSDTWDFMEPENSEGWEILSDTETTTRKSVQSWTPKTWKWPEFPTRPTTSTTTAKPETSARKPLPDLEDFLKSQYGSLSNRDAPKSTIKPVTAKPKLVIRTTPKSSTTTPKIIKIEDLPVVEILHNGKPANESILKSLPPHLTPRTSTEKVLNIEHKYPLPEDTEVSSQSSLETKRRTYSKTHIGPEKPTLKDLDPQMQDILKKAGIVPEIEGDSVTKTRKEPDGRTITTTYKVNTVSSAPVEYTPTVQHRLPAQAATYAFNSYKPAVAATSSPIAEFLAKLGLTKFDIVSRKGHYTKTFVDENGDVLTATFVLSSLKGVTAEEMPQPKPLK